MLDFQKMEKYHLNFVLPLLKVIHNELNITMCNYIFSIYSSDERVIEYDIDKVLYDKRSDFQKIQIVHSKSLGNMLVLDELQSMY